MPSQARDDKAPARGAPEAGPRRRPDTGAWSQQLAACPRQLRQAEQLRGLFGERAGPQDAGKAGVVQGMFVSPDNVQIDNAEAARTLASQVAETAMVEDQQAAAFGEALVQLATDGQDHGQLSLEYLHDLLKRGPVREAFSITQDARRLHTKATEENPNFPPKRSATGRKLKELAERAKEKTTRKRKTKARDAYEGDDERQPEVEAEPTGDFSYRDMHAVLQEAGVGRLPPDAVLAATRQAVTDWQELRLSVSEAHPPVDVQLVVQHLLHYQKFNSPELKGRYKAGNEPEPKRIEREQENAARQHELEKSSRLLQIDAPTGFALTVPADPTGPGHMARAFSALQDLNRPQPQSAMDGAAYKAVYKCVKMVLRKAWDLTQAATQGLAGQELDAAQRLRFNHALAESMPQFKPTTVTRAPGAGQQYVRDTIGLSRFSEAEELSGEDSEESADDAPLTPQMNASLVNEDGTLEENKRGMQTWSATVGTLSKLSLQKQLIDRATLAEDARPGAERKHERRRRKLERHVARVTAAHRATFQLVQSELAYWQTKKTLLARKIKEADMGLQTARNPEDMDPEAEERFKSRSERAHGLLTGLNDFYAALTLRQLRAFVAQSGSWKRSHEILGKLGEQGLETYMSQGAPKARDDDADRGPPEKKKQKTKKKPTGL